jgi:hypothetical protein
VKQQGLVLVDVAFKSYFDTPDREILMAKVKEAVTDGSVLRLIRRRRGA